MDIGSPLAPVTYDGTFYEQTDGEAMGLLLGPVIVNIYVESFEIPAIVTASKKPSHWYRYVDTFVVWSHGTEEL